MHEFKGVFLKIVKISFFLQSRSLNQTISLAKTLSGKYCLETKTPLDLEKDIHLPRGNIFHKDLSFPFKEDDSTMKWGVETDHPRVFLCGAGAVRGGGVSGIAGHNAAMALLELS